MPFFSTRRPATSVAVWTQTPPVPLVAPFLATTFVPEPTEPKTGLTAPVEPKVAPTASPLRPITHGRKDLVEVVPTGLGFVGPQPRPQPPVQPRRVVNPSGAGMILGLISKGISQFTNSGWGLGAGEGGEAGGGGSFLSQIPQLIRSLQAG